MKRTFLASLALLSFLLPLRLSPAFAAEPPTVQLFSPQGTVKKVRQVTARFSEPMVPFGDPRLSDPFEIACPATGKGRWADGRNWIYDFDEDLPAGIACRFTLKASLATLSGKPVEGTRAFSFSTGGPAILRSIPYEGSRHVDENQAFLLLLDAEAKEESILAHASFSIAGVKESVGARIVKGEDRKALIESGPAKGWVRLLRPVYGRETVLTFRRKKDLADDPRIVVLQARRAFPPDADVTLRWEKGVEAVSGIATTEDQVLPFRTRPAFTVSFRCDREHKGAACIPILPMTLRFSAPVSRKLAAGIVLRGPGKAVYAPELPKDDGREDSFVYGVAFRGPFPEKTAFRIEIPADLVDDAGRKAANRDKFPLAVATAFAPPLAKFAAPFGIVELNGDAAIPLTVRNIEAQAKARLMEISERKPDRVDKATADALEKAAEIGERINEHVPASLKESGEKDISRIKGRVHELAAGREERIVDWLRRVDQAYWNYGYGDKDTRGASLLAGRTDVKEFPVPKPGGEKAFEVVGIPLPKPGFYVVEVESAKLGKSLLGSGSMFVSAAVLVTNLSAHLKKGRESSLVWVTTLDKGEPVAGAEVAVRDEAGKVQWQGTTDSRGIAAIRQPLPEPGRGGSGCGSYCGYFVTARKGDDMTFVFSSWDRGIELYRFGLPSPYRPDPTIGHTVFDRSLFRAGETVHMKHFLRRHSLDGLFLVAGEKLPKTLLIRHHGSDQRYELPLSWAPDGSAESEWAIPKEAKLGEYGVSFLAKDPSAKRTRTQVGGYAEGDEEYYGAAERHTGSFRVEEYRVPLMRGSVNAPGDPKVNVRDVELDLLVSYLSGGGAGGAAVRLRTDIRPKAVSFPDYGEYVFANGRVVEGISRETPRYDIMEDEEETGGEEEETAPDPAAAGKPAVRTRDLVLDAFGALRTKVTGLSPSPAPQDLVAELEYADPNGEAQVVSSRVPLWPSRVLLGIKPDSWTASQEAFRFLVLALDLGGKPAPGVPVSVDLFRRSSYSHRKRLIGGMYAYDHVTETKKIAAAICEGKTDAKGYLACEAKSPVSGNVILQASAKDAEGNVSASHRDMWVAGKEDWWFEASDADRIDLLPEKKRYEPGEKAVFQVRMPFREATVLVTVEREGVAESFVRKLSGKAPLVEVPVKPYYAPNVYVSVLCVRGRAGDVSPAAAVDLGKPAYKLGMAEIRVGWNVHEIKVDVSPEKPVYKVREKARVRIRAQRALGGPLPKDTSVLVAAVDEGLLELSPNGSWKLLDAMMGRRSCEVRTSTAQMQVVGKRHYGLKAQPLGGGGGRQAARELFDTLLLWKARVPLDNSGEATVEIPLNDSLTSFRIAAVASGGAEFFGTGETQIRTTQDLMLLSGLPPLVREDDRFRAGFTVRNASDRPLEVRAAAAVTPAPGPEPPAQVALSLRPGEAKEAAWELRVPTGAEALQWEVTAEAKDGGASDRLRVRQRVVPAVPVRTFQATLVQLAAPLSMPVKIPADAVPGRGGIDVSLRSRLSEGMGGVTWYMKQYPYTCLEQTVSRAVALQDEALWKETAAKLPSFLDGDGLAKYFPVLSQGSDSLTAYILSVVHEAGWEVPRPARDRMLKGLSGFVEGRVVRYGSLPTADLALRKLAALDALSRYGEGKPAQLGSIAVEPNLWPTSGVIDWANVLLRLKGVPDGGKRLAEAEGVLRSRMNFQGTTMGFSTERTDFLWWLMVSGDVNAVRALLFLADRPGWEEDVPRIVRGALGRQHRGAWNTTVANAWGVLAMEKFSKRFEAEKVSGTTSTALGTAQGAVDWEKTPKGKSVRFGWPQGGGTLTVAHRGTGRPWATVQSLAAIPLKKPFSSGYAIRKTLTPVQRKEQGRWSRGDAVRVTLEIESQADMTWVVVNDPIPAGGTILGAGLGRDSRLLTRGEKREGLAWPAFTERSFEAFRAYYEYVPKGKWTVEYTVRLNNGGTFALPATRVEALYAPEMFGELPNATVAVAP
jgi:uncharacterized protein YfaS (alpha-2-macroglobulin family)